MSRLVVLLALVVMTAACVPDTNGQVPTTDKPVSTTTTSGVTTTSAATTTTASPGSGFPVYELPLDGPCSLGPVPDGGQPTVVVNGRMYGLEADGSAAVCLVDGITGGDIDWGPMGDRVRVGTRVVTQDGSFQIDGAVSFEWTGPTGSRIVAVNGDRVWKIDMDGLEDSDITFLRDTLALSYHPAGEHLLALGTSADGQYGLWLASNQGTDPLLLAFDEGATMSNPAWSWLGEPVFAAGHFDGAYHIHRVELTEDGALEGPIVVESEDTIDMLRPSRHDPVLLAYRSGGVDGQMCVDGAHAAVNGVDIPEPVASLTSTPIGWLSIERLLVITFPDGCDAPGDLWAFSAGFCPGSVYGVTPIISGVDGAAAREAAPSPPPPPDFTGIIDPGPA